MNGCKILPAFVVEAVNRNKRHPTTVVAVISAKTLMDALQIFHKEFATRTYTHVSAKEVNFVHRWGRR